MSVYAGPEISQSGLVFAYDMGNINKSWKGAPTTNLSFGNFFNGNANFNVNQTITDTMPDGSLGNARELNAATIVDPNRTVSIGSYALSAGSTYTLSFYVKNINCTGFNGNLYSPTLGGSIAGINYPTIINNTWIRVVTTFTVPTGSGTPVTVSPQVFRDGGFGLFRMCWLQLEERSFATPYTNNSRSNTQAILDLTGLNTITATSLTYNSNNTFSFNGTTNKIYQSSIPASYTAVSNLLPRSWEAIVRPATNLAYAAIFGHKVGAGCSYFCNGGLYIYNSKFTFNWWDNSNYFFLDSGITAAANQTYHVVGTFNPSDLKNRIYVNGVLCATSSATNMNYGGGIYESNIGWNSKNEFGGGGGTDDYFNGTIPIARYYSNKILSDSEIRQNFNALRGRFGI